jgi:hypothetical protein
VSVSNQETSEGLAVECPVAFEPDILLEASLLGSRAVLLGERHRLLSESSETGTPLVRLASKQILKYYRRARKARGAPVKDSLILEAMEELGVPPMHFQSMPVAQFVAQSMPRTSDVQEYSKTEKGSFLGVAAPLKSAPQQGLLRRGFRNPRSTMKGTSSPSSKSPVASSSTMVVAVKGEDSNLNGLTHSQKWPVGFSPSGEIIIRD